MYKVYQITDKTVSDEQIGKYIDIIAKSIVFDKETKMEISQKYLGKIKRNMFGEYSSRYSRSQ